jgi:hypothetical protein
VTRPAQEPWGGNVLGEDSFGERFIAYAPTGYDVAVARRTAGEASWMIETVDWVESSAHSLPDGTFGASLPFLAIDPLDSPSLSWTWTVGADSTSAETHLFLARKP